MSNRGELRIMYPLVVVAIVTAGCGPEVRVDAGATGTGGTGGVSQGVGRAGGSVPPSCVGLPNTCGPGGNENCCASTVVTGGTYNRSNDPMYPATVSDFRLDRFEITVGRFRAFVAAYPGSKPAAGAGAHPLIAGSGWDPAWDGKLPMDQAALVAAVQCGTWTNMAGANENLPMSCISWYDAFAFCAWDGGRLPTEAEWNYAAAAGAEQREYPWSSPPSSTAIDSSYAVYCEGSGFPPNPDCDILQVGSKSPKGDGKWGQADLAGNVWEWNLDEYAPYQAPCNNCAHITSGYSRVDRGGPWKGNQWYLLSSKRATHPPGSHYDGIGARCARSAGATGGGDADAGGAPDGGAGDTSGYPDGGQPLPGSGTCHPAYPCPADEFCWYVNLSDYCGYPLPGVMATGICMKRPTDCTDVCPAACGCDGKWYCNPCQANAAGYSIGPKTNCPP